MVRDDTVTSGTLALRFAVQLLVRCRIRQHNRFDLSQAASGARAGRSALHKLEIKIKTMVCLGLRAVLRELLKMVNLSEL
jgi:hypothetical protein